MSEPLYSREKLDKAVKASNVAAGKRPVKKVSEEAGDMEVQREIPMELFLNAVQGHGVDPNDTDYWRDQEKYVPSIKVQNISIGKMFFGSTSRTRRNWDDIFGKKEIA